MPGGYVHIDDSSPKYNVPDNPYFKSMIAFRSNQQYVTENYTESNIFFCVFNDSFYHRNTSGEPVVYPYESFFKIDGVEQTSQSGQVSLESMAEHNTASQLWKVNNYHLQHDLDGTKTVKLEGRAIIYDPDDNTIVFVDTGWVSWKYTVPRIADGNEIDVVLTTLDYVSERSISISATAVDGDPSDEIYRPKRLDGVTVYVNPSLLNNGLHPCPPYPIPPDYHGTDRKHYWHWWYCSVDGGETWIDYALFVEPPYKMTDLGINANFEYGCWYTEWDYTIYNLSPDTTYHVVFAVHAPIHQEGEPENPGPPNGDRDEWEYSKVLTIKTDKVPTPLPLNPNDTGLSRRITLYDSDEYTFTSNGLGSLIEAFSCTVTEEINGIFELEMEYPVDGKRFNDIDFGRIITANPNQYTSPQPFRIYSISKPHNGKITINAQHISYDLSGITVSPFKAGSVQGILAKLAYGSGTAADVFHRFRFWTDIMAYTEINIPTPMSIRSILGDQGPFLSVYGGEYEFDVFNVKLWSRRGSDRGVTISYGKNLTSLKQDANSSNVYTGVRAYWYKAPSDNDPGGLVTCGIVNILNAYDTHTRILALDLTSSFDEKPTSDQLSTMAQQYIIDNNLNSPIVSLSVSFVQLSDSLEYKDVKMLEEIKLGDYVTVKFPKLNINTKVECVKTVFNVLSQRYNSIDLGVPKSNLASTVSNNTKATSNAVQKADPYQTPNSGSSSSITSGNRYIILDYSVDPPRLLSMDAPTQSQAKYVWKLDFDGFSHSSNGVDGPYVNVMPMSGGVNASSISRGQINGNMIRQETITKGSMSDGYIDYMYHLLESWRKKLSEESKFGDGVNRNINDPLFTNQLVIGNVKIVPVSGGADLMIF